MHKLTYAQIKMTWKCVVVKSGDVGPEKNVVARAGRLGDVELLLGVIVVPPRDRHA